MKYKTPRRIQRQTKEESAHIKMLHTLSCVVCDMSGEGLTVHHVHGGSMLEIPGFDNPGGSQKASDFLAIPLWWIYHTGALGIDSSAYSPNTWEPIHGTQVMHLDTVCRLVGYNVWELAGINREVEGL